MRLVSALVLSALLAGCSASAKSRRLEGRYELPSPGQGWRSVSPGGADQAWNNEALSASIYADSNCGIRYEDTELRALSEHLTLGLAGQVEVSFSEGRLDGRDAFTRQVTGRLDGVPVALGITVLKKHQCVYDLVLIAPPSNFEAAWEDYLVARDGFRTRGGGS